MMLEGCARVLFLHAHPDDETLATGALIADLVARGVEVAVVTATRGERGETTEPMPAGDLVALRERELSAALAALGVHHYCFLGTPPARAGAGDPRVRGDHGEDSRGGGEDSRGGGEDSRGGSGGGRGGWEVAANRTTSTARRPRRYTDSGMVWVTPEVAGPGTDAGPDSLTAAATDEAAADLAGYAAWFGAQVLVSYDRLGGYGHPDHVACHWIARAAAKQLGIRFVEVVSGATEPELDQYRGVVAEALRCYRSQLRVDGDEVVHVGGQRQPIPTVVALRDGSGRA